MVGARGDGPLALLAERVDAWEQQARQGTVEREAAVAHQAEQVFRGMGDRLHTSDIHGPGDALQRMKGAKQSSDFGVPEDLVVGAQQQRFDGAEMLVRLDAEFAPERLDKIARRPVGHGSV